MSEETAIVNGQEVPVNKIPDGRLTTGKEKVKKPETLQAINAGKAIALGLLEKTDSNISISVSGDILTITIDRSKYQRESGSGESIVYGSTDGNFSLPDQSVINVNFFRPFRYFAEREEKPVRKITVKGW